MEAGIYIEMNILSSLVCILLFYQQKRHKVFDFLGTTAFNSILWTAVFIMAADIVSWLMVVDALPCGDTVLVAVQSLYYLLQALLPMFFFGYCLDVSGYPATGLWKILMYVPVALTAVLLIANFDGGMVFYVLEGRIKRGGAFLLAVAAPMIYVINSLALCTFFYFSARKHNAKKRKIAFHMVVCIGMSFVVAVGSAFITSINPWHVFVTALVYLYVQLHSYQEHDLDARASTDSLTGLKNHAAYSVIKEKMDNRINAEPGIRFAVAVMDVNNLKRTNDVYGHEAGNALIIGAARLMCEVFQHSPVCRIGGDEFVAVLENGDYENRADLREEFAQRMMSRTFSAGSEQLPISAAIGIAEYHPERHEVFENVFQDADEAMYVNKAQIKSGK